MRILLLGPKGQVGWELQRMLICLGEVTSAGYPELDMARPDAIRTCIRRVQPQMIVNATAYTDVDRAESEPEKAFAINGVAPGVLAEEARAIDAVLVHYSTDYVFNGKKGAPHAEEDAPDPLNVYGKSKLQGERAIQQADIPFFIFRTSWVYGMRRKNFVTKALDWAQRQPHLNIVDDQIGNPTWCRMLAQLTTQVLLLACQNGKDWLSQRKGLYHLAGGGFASRYDVVRTILANLPRDYPLTARSISPASTHEFVSSAERPLFSALDTTKFTRCFGVEIPAWETCLKLALADFFETKIHREINYI
ncbi:MAG TPA: dTDP-4-dehydrorhamnose reductase [Anaerolineales bacterium]|nr:dTDP-4-dehydrorhamnose reductase [Anaerolineales bacterium]